MGKAIQPPSISAGSLGQAKRRDAVVAIAAGQLERAAGDDRQRGMSVVFDLVQPVFAAMAAPADVVCHRLIDPVVTGTFFDALPQARSSQFSGNWEHRIHR